MGGLSNSSIAGILLMLAVPVVFITIAILWEPVRKRKIARSMSDILLGHCANPQTYFPDNATKVLERSLVDIVAISRFSISHVWCDSDHDPKLWWAVLSSTPPRGGAFYFLICAVRNPNSINGFVGVRGEYGRESRHLHSTEKWIEKNQSYADSSIGPSQIRSSMDLARSAGSLFSKKPDVVTGCGWIVLVGPSLSALGNHDFVVSEFIRQSIVMADVVLNQKKI